MVDTVTETVGPGKTRASVSVWEAANQADLTSEDEIRQAEVYSFEDTTAFTIDGWTTSATQYARIFAADGEGHSGFWDEAKFFISQTNGDIINVSEEFVRFEGLQFELTVNSGANLACLHVNALAAANKIQVSKCLFKGIISGNNTSITGIYGHDTADGDCLIIVTNSIAFNFFTTTFPDSPSLFGFRNQFSDMRLYNCITYNCGTGFKVDGSTFKTTAVNCLGYNEEKNSGNFIDFSASANFQNSSNNVSTDGTAPGTTVLINQASTDIDLLSETDTNSAFLAIDSTSTCVGAGTDDPLSGVYSDDIRGDTRTSTWDVGADEFVAAGGVTLPSLVMAPYLPAQ